MRTNREHIDLRKRLNDEQRQNHPVPQLVSVPRGKNIEKRMVFMKQVKE